VRPHHDCDSIAYDSAECAGGFLTTSTVGAVCDRAFFKQIQRFSWSQTGRAVTDRAYSSGNGIENGDTGLRPHFPLVSLVRTPHTGATTDHGYTRSDLLATFAAFHWGSRRSRRSPPLHNPR